MRPSDINKKKQINDLDAFLFTSLVTSSYYLAIGFHFNDYRIVFVTFKLSLFRPLRPLHHKTAF